MKYLFSENKIVTMPDECLIYHNVTSNFEDRFTNYVELTQAQIDYHLASGSYDVNDVNMLGVKPIEFNLYVYIKKFITDFTSIGQYDEITRHCLDYIVKTSKIENIEHFKLFNSQNDYDVWLNSKLDIVYVSYEWDKNLVHIKCDNNKTYTFDCHQPWSDYDCQNKIYSVDYVDCPVLVLPLDLAEQLQGYNVKEICVSDTFKYECSNVEVNGVEVSNNYLMLCPIEFNSIDVGDVDIINNIRNQWNDLNPNRKLPDNILFSSRYDLFNYFNPKINTNNIQLL